MNKKGPNLKNLFETLVNDNITTLKMVPTINTLYLARLSNRFWPGGALHQPDKRANKKRAFKKHLLVMNLEKTLKMETQKFSSSLDCLTRIQFEIDRFY